LIARGRVPLLVVLSKLRAEETHLRGVGLLGIPSVLAAQAPPVLTAAPGLSPSDGMGRLPSSGGGRSSRGGSHSRPSRIQCGYCQKPGHPETDC
jgi:hypothetical protein